LAIEDASLQNDGQSVLSGISLEIPFGQHVAIGGPSGAGKTALLALFARRSDPTTGTVRLGGVDLRERSPGELRRRSVLVDEVPFIFHDTVRANVAFSRPEATDDDVWEALRLAHAEGFVRALPNGIDTEIGIAGRELSGGQRQRL